MLKTLKKFKLLYIILLAAVFIFISLFCLFKFNVFADGNKPCFYTYVSGASELEIDPNYDNYPILRPEKKIENGKINWKEDHSFYIYTYNLADEFLYNLLGNDTHKLRLAIEYMGKLVNPNNDQVIPTQQGQPEEPVDIKDMAPVIQVHQYSPFASPATKVTFSQPGFYEFKLVFKAEEFNLPNGYVFPVRSIYRVCVSDIKSQGEDVTYDGAAHCISVDPGKCVEGSVQYSTIDPRTVGNPESDCRWSEDNPSYTDVGTHITYYRVKCKMPVYNVDGQGVDHEHIFYGSETVKINAKNKTNEGRKNIFETATGVTNPSDGAYDNIYLGSFANGSQSSGIKFKLLNTSANDDFYRGGYFLMSNNVLGNTAINTDESVDKMFYTGSLLSEYMDHKEVKEGSGQYIDVYHSAFTDLERNGILKLNSKSEEDDILSGVPGTAGQTIIALGSFFKSNIPSYLFPLSGVEAHNTNYGFSHTLGSDSGRNIGNSSDFDRWWSRSFYRMEYYQGSGAVKGLAGSTDFNCGAFEWYGNFEGRVHEEACGIRPALNFDPSKVVFTSAASYVVRDSEKKQQTIKGAKALPTTENFVKTDGQHEYTDFRFTLEDDNLKFNIDNSKNFIDSKGDKDWTTVKAKGLVATTESRDITIPYKDVVTNVDRTYLSLLIINSETGAVEYYGRPQAATSTDGNLKITLPLDLEKGEYKLKLFEEQYNGGNSDNTNLTDYASKPVEIKLTMLQTIEYDERYCDQLNKHVYYDGQTHGVNIDFQVIPKDPVQLSDVNITYADATDGLLNFTDSPVQKINPLIDENGNVIPYKIAFKLSPKNYDPETENYKAGNYYAEKIEYVYLTIEKRPIQYVAPSELDVLYDGTFKTVEIQVSQPTNVHIQYKVEGETDFHDSKPVYKDVKYDGDKVVGYKVEYKITDPDNTYADAQGYQELVIEPRQIQYYATSVEAPYNGQPETIEVQTSNEQPPQGVATIKYSKTGETGSYNEEFCPTYTEVGDYDIYFQITAPNYQTVYGKSHLKIDKGTIIYTVQDLQADYNGYYHEIDMRVQVADAAKTDITYYTDAQHQNKVEPYFKDATNGKQNIYYHIDAGSNYESIDGVTTVDIRPATITYKLEDISTLTYDGDKHGAVLSTTNVDDSGSTITYSEDGVNYGLVNPRYSDAGTYTVYYKIDANNYKEIKGQVTFTIQPRPMSYVYIEEIPGRIFNGAPITPSVIVHDGDPSIIRDDDYDVSYTDNTAPGMGIVTLTGKHNYEGTTTKHFMIYSNTDTNGASEAYTFDVSGSNLLGMPSFGTSSSKSNNNTTANSTVDTNNQDANQNPTDNNTANQDDNNKNNDPNANNTPKPKSFRDYIYMIIGGAILLLSILAVLILKIRSHKVKDKPIDVENIEIPEPTNDAK